VPYAQSLERHVIPQVEQIVTAGLEVVSGSSAGS
jgi:hypothetical protein